MSFDFNLFDINKEMESLNNRLENKRDMSEERPLPDIKKNGNIFNVESESKLNVDNVLILKHIEKENVTEKKEEEGEKKEKEEDNFGTEFIIIEKDDNTNSLSISEQLKRKREEKKRVRLERKKMLKKERDDFFNKSNQKPTSENIEPEPEPESKSKPKSNSDVDSNVSDSNVVINHPSDKLILQNLTISKNKEEINSSIQSRVKEIINIEKEHNNEILNLQTNYTNILEEKDYEIIRLKQKIHDQNIQNSEIDKKVDKKVNKELEKIRSEKKKEFSKLEKKRKIMDKRIKEQQLKLKKETEKLKKQQEEIISLKKIKDKELSRIVSQTNISESLNEEKEDFKQDTNLEEVLLKKKIANTKNKNSLEYKQAVESYRIILRNRQNKKKNLKRYVKNKKKENSNNLVPNVANISNIPNIPNISNNIKVNNRVLRVKKFIKRKKKQKSLSDIKKRIYNSDICLIDNINKKIMLEFLISKNVEMVFFDQYDKKIFSLVLKKNFEILFRKYTIESYIKKGKTIYVEKVEEEKRIKKKFKRWSISWNGLVGIDKQKFIESLLIETSSDNNFYNINLFGDLLFNIKKTNQIIKTFKTNHTIFGKYI
jgi:hypothetical protein